MDKFEKIIASQRAVPGLQDLNLYSPKGRAAYACNPASLKSELPPDLRETLLGAGRDVTRRTDSFEM
ncbi:MAG: hypothetical protein U1F98_12930 [Verrucomicrobiota bacterium]